MIKSVLSAIRVYYLVVYRASNRAALALDRLFKKFLWEGSKEDKKIPLINWETTCLTKEEGGVGLHKMNL